MFDKQYGIAMHSLQGNWGSVHGEGESLMGFLELRQESGVYTQVMAGISIENSSLFSEVRTPV